LCAAPEFAADNIDFTTIYMPLVRTPMIAPTSLYKAFPTLSPEQARDLVIKAILSNARRPETHVPDQGGWALSRRRGRAGDDARRHRGLSQPGLCACSRDSPDSAAARGLSEEGGGEGKVSGTVIAAGAGAKDVRASGLL
jgi:hypothetical protein